MNPNGRQFYHVTLDAEERLSLEDWVEGGTGSKERRKRAHISAAGGYEPGRWRSAGWGHCRCTGGRSCDGGAGAQAVCAGGC